jgi:predicted dehydrogenase
MRKVKVGIIGVGGIAEGKHMPSLAKIPNVEMDLTTSKWPR